MTNIAALIAAATIVAPPGRAWLALVAPEPEIARAWANGSADALARDVQKRIEDLINAAIVVLPVALAIIAVLPPDPAPPRSSAPPGPPPSTPPLPGVAPTRNWLFRRVRVTILRACRRFETSSVTRMLRPAFTTG